MTLIEELQYNSNVIRFYEGIDFEKLIKHPSDGSDGFIFCFIENWVTEIKSYKRDRILDSVMFDDDYKDFDWKTIENDYISIYQTSGVKNDVVYQTVKNKILKQSFPDSPWIPISGISKGAWKIL